MAKETTSSNFLTAAIIASFGCVLFIMLLVGLYVAPARLLRVFDTVEIKVVLAAISLAFIVLSGVLVFSMTYLPSVRRLGVSAYYSILAFSSLSMGYSVIGWPKLKTIEWDGVGASAGFFDIKETSLDTYPVLLTCLVAIVSIMLLNVLIRYLDVKYDFEF